jgi:hypothetical protein
VGFFQKLGLHFLWTEGVDHIYVAQPPKFAHKDRICAICLALLENGYLPCPRNFTVHIFLGAWQRGVLPGSFSKAHGAKRTAKSLFVVHFFLAHNKYVYLSCVFFSRTANYCFPHRPLMSSATVTS